MKLISAWICAAFWFSGNLAATITLYDVQYTGSYTLPFTVPQPSMTMHAIGTASNGETTYAIDEVQSIFVDVNAIEVSGVTTTVASTYTSEPFTRHATLVEDATHRVYDIAYPTGDPAGPLVIHDDCSLDGNGTGQCVDVLQYPGIFPTPTTATVTYPPGPLTPIYTITVPDATATSAKPNGTISGRFHLREALIGWFMAVAGVLSAGVLLL